MQGDQEATQGAGGRSRSQEMVQEEAKGWKQEATVVNFDTPTSRSGREAEDDPLLSGEEESLTPPWPPPP